MSISQAIYGQLSTDVSVAALSGGRVFPHTAPPMVKEYPLVVYSASMQEPERHTTGNSSLQSYKVDVACIAITLADAEELADAVTDCLDNQSGTWGEQVVHAAFLEDDSEDMVTVADSPHDRYYILERSYLVWLQRPLTS